MGTRRNLIQEADRHARRQVEDVVRVLLDARLAAGLSQEAVATAIGVTHQLVSVWEWGVVMPDPVQFAKWGAVVGLDINLRAFAAGSPLRDAGQLKVLARTRIAIGEQWSWQTEVPVSSNPLDRRAIDAVIRHGERRIGLEIITRLTDAQAQVRAAQLKQEAAGLDRMILVLADTRHNRDALHAAAPTLLPAFPVAPRAILADLRAGRPPAGDGVVFV
jgi:transcriptional regulator with XRE-family HTH domain